MEFQQKSTCLQLSIQPYFITDHWIQFRKAEDMQ